MLLTSHFSSLAWDSLATRINGNYKVVYGLKLDRIPKGDIKIVINAHGNSEGIISRSIEEINGSVMSP
jgi:hypothetical protein